MLSTGRETWPYGHDCFWGATRLFLGSAARTGVASCWLGGGWTAAFP